MKFFDKTLDEIYDIVSEINEQLGRDRDWFEGLEFSFNEWAGYFSFKDMVLFSTENNQQQWIDELDEYEDLRVTLRRELIDLFDEYKKFEI
jgi:hypothetical protein